MYIFRWVIPEGFKLTYKDLSIFSKIRLGEIGKIHLLPHHRWVKVGGHWIYALDIKADNFDAYVQLICCRRIPLLNMLLRHRVWRESAASWHTWGDYLGDTGIRIDIWYHPDGVRCGIPFAVTNDH